MIWKTVPANKSGTSFSTLLKPHSSTHLTAYLIYLLHITIEYPIFVSAKLFTKIQQTQFSIYSR